MENVAEDFRNRSPDLERSMARASQSQLARLFHRLANSYRAGIDLRSALLRETESGSPLWRRELTAVGQDLQRGSDLATALRNRGEFFPKLVLAITRAGERGGRLEEAFTRLASHYDSLVRFRSRFLTAIAWPVFELCFAIAVIGFLILILGYIYESNHLDPPDWFGLGLGTRGNFVLFLFIVLAAGGGLAGLVAGTARGVFGTLPMEIARRLPVVGRTIECLSLSRFAWTASVAENAGMEAGETMQLALEATQNHFYERLIPEVTAGVRGGSGFHSVLSRTGAFPESFLMLVQNGETAGMLAESLERASGQLQEEAENNLRILAVVGFVLTFLFVAGIMAFAIISMYYRFVISPIRDFQM